jgi:hypothetical protein
MSTLQIESVPLAMAVQVTEDELIVSLADGRRISAPLAWFPRLLDATKEERADFRLMGGGEGIHWPQVDEDISVAGLLRGAGPARTHTRSSVTEADARQRRQYRRGEEAATWHWCPTCSTYPVSNYFVRHSRPEDELCNECAAKAAIGDC